MNKKMIAPLLIGFIGAAILFSLCIWQVQRLGWKERMLAAIEEKIAEAPVALPEHPDPATDRYLAVTVSGMTGPRELHVLTSRDGSGPGFRIVTTLDTGSRVILLDRGYVPASAKGAKRPPRQVTVVGNLHWPRETDLFTPEPDRTSNTWFARDVDKMAEELGAEPLMVVARSDTGDGVTPLPVDTGDIPNNHLNYAITWFLLGIGWLGMTGFWLWRIKRRID